MTGVPMCVAGVSLSSKPWSHSPTSVGSFVCDVAASRHDQV